VSVKKLFDLTGRVALVTGGSRGLGMQIAEALGEMGAKVAITARKQAELDEAKAHLAKMGIESLPISCDMSDRTAIPAMVQKAIEGLGPIDILVNNAGTTWGADMLEHPLDAWLKVMDLNLTAMFVTSQEVGRLCMVPRRRGTIVNIASILGLVGSNDPDRPGTIGYNTSKGGVISFTRALAGEWARHDIRVNAIAPGFFPSRMTEKVIAEKGEDAMSHGIPMRRIGRPGELKGVAVFLAAAASNYITGQTIVVDGGRTAV